MYSTVLSAAIHGLEVQFIHVEADISNGLPVFHMVGYLSSEVKEAGERVRTAIRNTGYQIPAKKIIVNLSPADVKKRGAAFDLPIAVAVLSSLGYVEDERIRDTLFIGELGLDGSVRRVPGILPVMIEAKKRGISVCVIPRGNVKEGKIIEGIRVLGVSSLKELGDYLNGKTEPGDEDAGIPLKPAEDTEFLEDFSDIRGQAVLKRAVEVAVAGHHNILFVGSPGAGKTMIARRIPGIFPPLTEEESVEITKIYSILGMTDARNPLVSKRPFRSPHHTVTRAALAGGGNIPHPGEISLANHGVLFLDELSEFQRPVLDVLRQPLEERSISLSRKSGVYKFPANFMLVAATNPCHCGYYPDYNRCTCTPAQVQQYQSRISQPLLDRIDICAGAAKVEYEELCGHEKPETSRDIRERICRAREIQYRRYGKAGTNAELRDGEVERFCLLGKKEQIFMKQVFERMSLTVRTYHKVLKVARTIADLAGEDEIQIVHLREAAGYRTMERRMGNR